MGWGFEQGSMSKDCVRVQLLSGTSSALNSKAGQYAGLQACRRCPSPILEGHTRRNMRYVRSTCLSQVHLSAWCRPCVSYADLACYLSWIVDELTASRCKLHNPSADHLLP